MNIFKQEIYLKKVSSNSDIAKLLETLLNYFHFQGKDFFLTCQNLDISKNRIFSLTSIVKHHRKTILDILQ